MSSSTQPKSKKSSRSANTDSVDIRNMAPPSRQYPDSSNSYASDLPFASRGSEQYPPPPSDHITSPQGSALSPNQGPSPISPTGKTSGSLGRKKSLVRPERRRSVQDNGTLRRRLRNNLAAAELVRDTRHDSLFRSMKRKKAEGPAVTWWVILSWILTFYLPNFVIAKFFGKRDPYVQQAFREKIALCTIIFLMMLIVGFLTFGFQNAVCIFKNNVFPYASLAQQQYIGIKGQAWEVDSTAPHTAVSGFAVSALVNSMKGGDASGLFIPKPGSSSCDVFSPFPVLACTAKDSKGLSVWPSTASSLPQTAGCHSGVTISKFLKYKGELTVSWKDVDDNADTWMVYNGKVLNLASIVKTPIGTTLAQNFSSIKDQILDNLGRDSTRSFAITGKQKEAQCLVELYAFATLDFTSSGCLASTIVLFISFVIIVGVVLARFILALYFIYVIGWRLGNNKAYAQSMDELRKQRMLDERRGSSSSAVAESVVASGLNDGASAVGTVDIPLTEGVNRVKGRLGDPRFAHGGGASSQKKEIAENSNKWSYNFGFMDMDAPPVDPETEKLLNDPTLMHVLVMVPCYSEGEESLKATLSSVAQSYYPSTHKCLFVVADGIVKGSENNQTTPDILIDMIEVDERFRKEDPRWGGEPEAYSYVAIADGTKRKNYARVYAGWYRYDLEGTEAGGAKKSKKGNDEEVDDSKIGGANAKTLRQRTEGRVPMLLVVKCGNDEERDPENPSKKPGNRGKRDSQIILMNFLSKVMFDDRMTELEFDIFFKLFTITGVNPEKYESVLMVDADTRIYPDSLTHMVACLLRDHRIMGICGETKIMNKWESWVTMIQVFEYFISHHLAKAFESVFGAVTCLPGCFCMYRIKTPKGPNGYWVPILANPDIVEEYSENVVDTLHKKNLLLLGEDRFLSTMMLRNFPKRRMLFVPPAICKTVVPNTFKVLLSQRRRWINSTIHNLMELVLVKDLCGTFCISMQFVIFMELVGTVVLPAAISFTITLIFMSIFKVGDTFLPLILLAIILGLPAILIVMTSNRLIYVFWMFIYLLSLPIWNFVLPLYAFWHFDDFSWGETRKVSGEAKGADHGAREGEFDSTGISMKRWREWVKARRDEAEVAEQERNMRYLSGVVMGANGNLMRGSTMSSMNGAPHFPMPNPYFSSPTPPPGRLAHPPPQPPFVLPPIGLPAPPPPHFGHPMPLPPGVMPPPGMMAPPPGMMPPGGFALPPHLMHPIPGMGNAPPPPPGPVPGAPQRLGSVQEGDRRDRRDKGPIRQSSVLN
ncbi:Chitin synthase, class 3 [Phlyctochytrium planicorne]|nr:Chitin synthase, class 3 [Phlyctochytrium planicorne]